MPIEIKLHAVPPMKGLIYGENISGQQEGRSTFTCQKTPMKSTHFTVVLIRDQTRSVTKQVSVAVGWVKIKISLMAQVKGLTAKFKLM